LFCVSLPKKPNPPGWDPAVGFFGGWVFRRDLFEKKELGKTRVEKKRVKNKVTLGTTKTPQKNPAKFVKGEKPKS